MPLDTSDLDLTSSPIRPPPSPLSAREGTATQPATPTPTRHARSQGFVGGGGDALKRKRSTNDIGGELELRLLPIPSSVIDRLIQELKLSAGGAGELRRFGREPLELQLLMNHALDLQVKDKVDRILRHLTTTFSIATNLRMHTIKTACGFVLAYDSVAYKFGSIEVVMLALSQAGVDGMPDPNNAAQCAMLHSLASDKLTQARCFAKIKMFEFLAPLNDEYGVPLIAEPEKPRAPVDIATLTAALADGTRVPITTDLFRRIAFLRRFMRTCEGALTENGECNKDWDEPKFWDAVDKELEAWRNTSATDQIKIMNDAYKRDVKLYGPPSEDIAVTAELPDWYLRVNELAKANTRMKSKRAARST